MWLGGYRCCIDFAFGSPALFLLLTGGFGVAVWNAIVRRDGPSTLAMAVAAVATGHLAGLPAWLLVWACTIVAIAIGMSLAALLLRVLAGSDAFRTGAIGTLAMAVLLVAHSEHSLLPITSAFSAPSLALGDHLHRQIDLLVRD